ncbi:MAG: cobyric acid synthase [Lachnoclostridium sp.]|nr:cobyric acid synthase [Lachnoclostridium sp.]
MLGGTGSDVGKSLIATGLCRIFKQDGYNPAPFKAQNMALNSFVTADGLEIGRAQAVQAEAAGVACSADMNPLLLKPLGNMKSQVVLNGRPLANVSSRDYYRDEERRKMLRTEVEKAFDRLSAKYNPVVMEGAGSIAELNLQKYDLVNMSMAEYAYAKVILVADIDRGGVFASVYGSIMLQNERYRDLIKGVIINKFRGDISLFDEGRKMLVELCGVPVLGVVPYSTDFHIDEEDSVALSRKIKNEGNMNGKIIVSIVLISHISNFTDFNSLEHDNRFSVRYVSEIEDINSADIIIIPGSKNTIDDLQKLHHTGMSQAIIKAAAAGKVVIGVCGGYQMLGDQVNDPDGVEGEISCIAGLGLLPVVTTLLPEKLTRQTSFKFLDYEDECFGYEIHAGITQVKGKTINHLDDGREDGCTNNNVYGTYLHGIFDNNSVRDYFYNLLKSSENEEVERLDYKVWKEQQYDLLANHLRKYIDIDKLYDILKS